MIPVALLRALVVLERRFDDGEDELHERWCWSCRELIEDLVRMVSR